MRLFSKKSVTNSPYLLPAAIAWLFLLFYTPNLWAVLTIGVLVFQVGKCHLIHRKILGLFNKRTREVRHAEDKTI